MIPLRRSHVWPAFLALVMTPGLFAGGDGAPALRLLQESRPLVIAHRGYSAAAPENTLPAFALALLAGADLVELDYQHSADGQPVVMHDATLDRTTDAAMRWGTKGLRPAGRTAAEFLTLDAGGWFDPRFAGTPPPLLAPALDFICRDGVALIERKAGDAATCVRLLQERGLINRVVVQSFDWDYLRACHALAPDQVLGALGPRWRSDGSPMTEADRQLTEARLDEIAALGARVVVWSRDLSAAAVAAAHVRGLRVWVYTLDDPAVALGLRALGVDGFITNQPVLLRQKLSALAP